MNYWLSTKKGEELLKSAFDDAGLPEVDEAKLKPGTYTNRQIAKQFESPEGLSLVLKNLLELMPENCDAEGKRRILGIIVDKMQEPIKKRRRKRK